MVFKKKKGDDPFFFLCVVIHHIHHCDEQGRIPPSLSSLVGACCRSGLLRRGQEPGPERAIGNDADQREHADHPPRCTEQPTDHVPQREAQAPQAESQQTHGPEQDVHHDRPEDRTIGIPDRLVDEFGDAEDDGSDEREAQANDHEGSLQDLVEHAHLPRQCSISEGRCQSQKTHIYLFFGTSSLVGPPCSGCVVSLSAGLSFLCCALQLPGLDDRAEPARHVDDGGCDGRQDHQVEPVERVSQVRGHPFTSNMIKACDGYLINLDFIPILA